MAFFDDLSNLIATQTDPSTHTPPKDVLASMGVPAASIAILEDGKISSTVISILDVNEETVFQAASISKPIAATVIFRAAQQGHLSLTAPISTYLSDEQMSLISTAKTKALIQHITLEMLLSHTSGLSQHGFSGYKDNPPSTSDILSGKPPSNTLQVHLESFPGQKFEYSGGGLTVAQLVLETVLKKQFPEIMQDLLFQPLDMRRSFYSLGPDEKNFANAYWTAYTPCDPPHHILPELAAAGLWTTPSDLLKVVHAIQASLDGTGDLLEPQRAKLMLTEVKSGMARGWMSPKEDVAFSHSGYNEPGYQCFVLGYADLQGPGTKSENVPTPALNCGLSVMTNSAAAYSGMVKIVSAIISLKAWPALSKSQLIRPGPVPFAIAGSAKEGWKEWRGRWSKDWEILGHDTPSVKFQGLFHTDLHPAATPQEVYPEGSSIDLVVDGLEMMLRLGWKEGKRIIELWDGAVAVLELGSETSHST